MIILILVNYIKSFSHFFQSQVRRDQRGRVYYVGECTQRQSFQMHG